MSHADEVFFRRWQVRHDADAFAELVSRHSGMMYAAAKRVLGSGADAEDVVQESFLRLARQDQAIASLPGWLYQVAVRLSLNRLRGEQRRHERETRYLQEYTASESDVPQWDEILPVVDEAVAELPEKVRAAVVLRFLEGQTHAAAAKELGVSRGTVQKRINKGLGQIRIFLDKRGITASSAALGTLFATHLEAEAAPSALLATLGKQTLASMGTAPTATGSNLLLKGAILMLSKKTVASLGVFAILVLLALLAVNVSFTGRGGDTPPNGVTVSGSGDVDSLDSPPPSVDEGEEEAVALDQVAPEDASGDLIATGAEESGAESEREAKAEEESASVAGMVTDEDAFPVADAHVWIDVHGPGHRVVGSFETRTGPDGHYTFSDITLAPPGWSYGGDFGRVSVESKGHVMTRRDIWGLNAGESRTDVDIVLTRASQFVMGIVVSEDGDAVPGAKVELLKYREPGARREKRGEAMFTVTDPKGQFELAIPGTEPVLCALRILKDGHAEGRFLNVETGTENARFALPGFGAIAGRVTNEDGSPSAGTVVGVTSERGYNEPGRTQPPLRAKQMGVTDADGNYRVEELSPHLSYNLGVFDKPENEIQREWWEWMVFGNGELLRMQSEVEDLHVDSGAVLPGIDFELADKYYVRISGHFFDEVSGKPALHTSIGFSFVTSDGDVSRPFFYGDEKGGYDVEFLLNEETTLSDFRLYHSSLIGNWPAGPVRRAEDGQPVQPISVSPGDELTLDLLARGNVNIPVRVVDGSGKAVPGAGVGVGRVHEDGRWQYATINTEQTDENGQCEFTGLPPTFTFFVWADKVPSGAALGSKRTPLAQFGPIQGEEGETVSEVVLVVDVKGGIECILVDAEGNPLNNVPITISAPGLDDGEPQTMHVQTDAIDGHITVLNALLPALYSEITFSATINGTQLQGRLEDVEVVGEGIVDLGVIPLHVVPEDTGGPAPDEASPER